MLTRGGPRHNWCPVAAPGDYTDHQAKQGRLFSRLEDMLAAFPSTQFEDLSVSEQLAVEELALDWQVLQRQYDYLIGIADEQDMLAQKLASEAEGLAVSLHAYQLSHLQVSSWIEWLEFVIEHTPDEQMVGSLEPLPSPPQFAEPRFESPRREPREVVLPVVEPAPVEPSRVVEDFLDAYRQHRQTVSAG